MQFSKLFVTALVGSASAIAIPKTEVIEKRGMTAAEVAVNINVLTDLSSNLATVASGITIPLGLLPNPTTFQVCNHLSQC
jgi:hypothetical protein